MAIVKGAPDAHGDLYDTESISRPPRPLIRVDHIPPEPQFFCVGVDLGSVNDSTAITVVEVARGWEVTNEYRHDGHHIREVAREPDIFYLVRLLHRPRLGVDYPKIIEQVGAIMSDLPPMPKTPLLAVDATGLGAPIVQQMRRQALSPIGISITAGQTASMSGSRDWAVPKALLVGELRLAMHRKRVKIAQGFAARETLEAELAAFTAKLSPSGRATFEAAGSEHDDTVLSLSIAVLAGKQRFSMGVKMVPIKGF